MLALLMVAVMSAPNPTVLTIPESDTKAVWMQQLHQCENPRDIPKHLDSNGYFSYGKYQWQMRSWLNYSALGATKQNITDDAMQDKITRAVLDAGGWRHWYTCAKLTKRLIGEYQ